MLEPRRNILQDTMCMITTLVVESTSVYWYICYTTSVVVLTVVGTL